MNYLEELLGGVPINGLTVGLVLLLIGAAVYLVKSYNKFKKYIINQYKEQEERDKKINKTFEEMKKYHEYRQKDREQSLEIQQKLSESIAELHEQQLGTSKHLAELEKRIINSELSSIKDRMMQSYRYYTSPNHNPTGAWTELEKEAWDEMMESYEANGGDGYMHTVVQPEMMKLIVIPMSDLEAISKLMHNRN